MSQSRPQKGARVYHPKSSAKARKGGSGQGACIQPPWVLIAKLHARNREGRADGGCNRTGAGFAHPPGPQGFPSWGQVLLPPSGSSLVFPIPFPGPTQASGGFNLWEHWFGDLLLLGKALALLLSRRCGPPPWNFLFSSLPSLLCFFETQRQCQSRKTQVFHSWFTPQMPGAAGTGVRLKPGAGNAMSASSVMARTQALESPSTTFQGEC